MTDTFPLLMVVGGYSDYRKDGIKSATNDVELISPTFSRSCSKAARPLPGITTISPINRRKESEGEKFGLTGQFSKEAPIICGGKNIRGNQNTCFEFDYTSNR